MSGIYLFLICFFWIGGVFSAALDHVQDKELRDINEVEGYFDAQKFSSLEEFIQALPDEIASFRTYVKKSLSLQSASLKNPRAIVSSPDGSVILTFNGDSTQKGFNEIEILAVDSKHNPTKWVSAVIAQNGNQLVFKRDVKECTSCHGNPIRPIWGNYPEWPNMYGSVDDWMPDPNDLEKGSPYYQQDRTDKGYGQFTGSVRLSDKRVAVALEESRNFREFKKLAKNHKRYSRLESGVSIDNPVAPFGEQYRTREYAERPNLLMGSVITLKHGQILANRVKNSSFYKAYRNSFLHYNSCGTYVYPFPFNKKIHNFFAKIYGSRFGRSFSENESEYFSSRYLDLFGIAPHEKTLLFERDTFYLKNGDDFYFSGFFSVNDVVSRILFEKYIERQLKIELPKISILEFEDGVKSLPIGDKLSKVFSYGNSRYQTPEGSISEEGTSEYEVICRSLKKSAQKELSQPVPLTNPLMTVASGPWPKALNTCIGCHEGSHAVATRIPYSSPIQLKEFDSSYVSSSGSDSLLDITWKVTDPNLISASQNGKRMPLGHPPLTQDQRDAIQNWIRQAIGR